MRRAHRIKSTIHLVVGAAAIACSFWQMDTHPAQFAWLIPMALGFFGIIVEIPEIARRDGETFDAVEVAALRRAFEAHCRTGGWRDSELALSMDGRYAKAILNEGWARWLSMAEATRHTSK